MLYHGLVLAGIFLIVDGISDLAYLPNALSNYDSDLKRMVIGELWWVTALAVVGATLLFSVIPGALLLKLAAPIADRFSRGEPVESFGFSDSGLYVVTFMLLSVYFLISGLSQTFAGLAQMAPWLVDFQDFSFLRYALGPLSGGVVKIVASVILYYHSLGAVRPVA